MDYLGFFELDDINAFDEVSLIETHKPRLRTEVALCLGKSQKLDLDQGISPILQESF